jgi:hypothetical protein
MSKRVLLAGLTSLILVQIPGTAQATWVHEDAKHGFRCRVPRFLKAQPLEPHEEQILAKFAGFEDSPDRFLKGKLELNLYVFRIQKHKGPKTGLPGSAEGEDGQEQDPVSIQQAKKAHLNGATTVEEFLKRRGIKHDLGPHTIKHEPKCRVGDIWKIGEIRDTGFNEARWQEREYPVVRTFAAENDTELFGLAAVGSGVGPFEALILHAVQSLERIDPATAASISADPYAGSTLRDIERRRVVRSRLVKGWSAYDTENFILITNSTNKKLINDILADLEIMRRVYEERFPALEPVTAVSTVRLCGSYEDYIGYGAPDGSVGFWNPLDEELVVFEPGKRIPKKRLAYLGSDPIMTMYHEAMHQYHHYSNGMVAPASWFNEGYGEYFGAVKIDRAKGIVTSYPKDPFRVRWVKQMQKEQAWPDLRIVLKMTKGEFYFGGSVMQNYAMGWAFCHFLELERAKTKDRNEEWAEIPTKYIEHLRRAAQKRVDKMPADAPKDWIIPFTEEIQAEAFEATFGHLDLTALERAWIEAMRKY